MSETEPYRNLIRLDDQGMLIPDNFFLSPINPTANVDQKAVESLAMEVLKTPEVKAARTQVVQRWKTIAGREWPDEIWHRFDQFVDEWIFHYCVVAANSDANHPKITGHLYGPPHEWLGMKVPGSRGCFGDGPDQNYAFIPMDVHGRYEIVGQVLSPGVSDFIVSLMGNVSMTMSLEGTLALSDLEIDDDGRFVITVDSDPANGRRNHIQSDVDTMFMFLRDCRADWRERPMALRVTRINQSIETPLSKNQIAKRAARWMVFDIPSNYWFLAIYKALPINQIPPPFDTGTIGGLPGQSMLFATLDIAPDEAFVLNIGEAGAKFTNIVLFDHLYMTFDYWDNTSTMNTTQGVANNDGSKTYVIAHQDPGVHNWLDTTGKQGILIVGRWQRVPDPSESPERPWCNGRLVKFSELNSVLSPDIQRVTPEQRQYQLCERQNMFALRYIHN